MSSLGLPRGRALAVLFLLSWGVFSIFCIKFVPRPFVLIEGVGIVGFAFLSWYFRQTLAFKFALNGVFLLTLALGGELCLNGTLEHFFSAKVALPEVVKAVSVPDGVRSTEDYFRDDSELGVAAKPNMAFRYVRTAGGKVVFDVPVTINQDGLRYDPALKIGSPTRSALFFGDSFTFGLGVADGEVFPVQFEKAMQGRFRAFNLGFQGHGPHQLLRRLEINDEAKFVSDLRPGLAVYLAHPDHLEWAAGRSTWEGAGPRYEFDKNGLLYFEGHFQPLIWVKVKRRLELSALFHWGAQKYAQRSMVKNSREYDLLRFVEIVDASRKIFEKRYRCRFFLILWADRNWPLYDDFAKEAKARNMSWVSVFDMIPEMRSGLSSYTLAFDGHPNARTHKLIGEYLSRYVVSFVEKEGDRAF